MPKWLNRILGRTQEATPADDTARAVSADAEQTGAGAHQSFSSDEPIHSAREDSFHRSGFAKRIAETLAGRKDPTSIVIGLYGPWGDGKTSTLNLMEETLEQHNHVVCVHFNPWHFQSEEQLLKGFFATLADALGKSLPTKREEIGEALKRYSGLLAFVGAGEAARSVGEALSSAKLEERRKRVEKLLGESGKRVVVLIDDIDRLYRTEIQAILKLVKLSASFNHTSYVLSFDDEMVAAAIGETYAEGGVEAGRSFLEKIVQVPLHLPPADEIALRRMTFDGVEAALALSDINLAQQQIDAFVQHFVGGLESRLETPRHAKLYGNALTFALPLLKGEAHPVDLMLIEGIRVFYPRLYANIRDNPNYFLRSAAEGGQQGAHQARAAELISQGLEGTGVQDPESIRRRLLEVLFPRLSNMGYGHEWDREWSREQRICSAQYFKRYFTYGVPPGDVADLEVARLLENFAAMEPADQDATLRAFGQRAAMPQLVRKLREHEDEITPDAARALALSIVRNASVLPRERAMFHSDFTYTQAAILVAQLSRRIPVGQAREALADDIFQQVQTLPFGVECLAWIEHNTDRAEAERILPQEAEERVSTALAERVRTTANEAPLYQTFGPDARNLYWLWLRHGDAAALREHLRRRFDTNPAEVDQLLLIFVREAWGLDSGLPRPGDLRRESYDAIARLFDPALIVENLRQRYPQDLGIGNYHQRDDAPIAERIAHQFVFIHRGVEAERAQAGGGMP